MNDLTGQVFGRWRVLFRDNDVVRNNGYREKMWRCVCECGAEKTVRGKSLTGGISKSCGCLQRELLSNRAAKHHGFGTRLYNIWNSMRQRCNNPNHKSFSNYGGRGIRVCDEWNDYSVFRDWAIRSGYDESAKRGELTLDRINVNLGYSPDNCRFVDMKHQAWNRRDSILVDRDGERLPLTEWAKRLGLDYTTLWHRYKDGKNIFG